MSSPLKPLHAMILIPMLLAGCGEGEEAGDVAVDETPAAIEAPALAPNNLVEDAPEAPEPPAAADR